MNKIIKLLICVLFLSSNNNSFIDAQNIVFQYYDQYNSNTFIRYPEVYNSQICSFNTLFWLIVDGVSIISVSDSFSSKPTLIASNSTHSLYSSTFNIDQGKTTTYSISAATSDSIITNFDQEVDCKDFDISQIDIEIVGPISFNPTVGFILLYKPIGIPSYCKSLVKINGIEYLGLEVANGYSITPIFYYSMIDKDISAPLQVSFTYSSSIIIGKTVQSYYNEYYTGLDYKINYYPSNWDQEIVPMGQSYYSLFSFETKSQSRVPYYSMVYDKSLNYIPTYKAIYETRNTTTYIMTPHLLNAPQLSNYQFFIQNQNTTYQLFSKTINTIGLPTTILTKFDSTSFYGDTVPLVVCDIEVTTERYYLNPLRFVLNNQVRDVSAPYGFYEGPNSAFKYILELPVSPYNPSATVVLNNQYYTITIDQDGNDPDTTAPILITYEFIYLTNSKYIFKVEIVDDGCGAATFSFNSNNNVGITRLSQYRVYGDATKGLYEIPIDFDIVLDFGKLTLYDLCGNSKSIMVGDFISSIPFNRFTVPFYSERKYNTYNIRDISYLYNNLDVRSKSVGNIVYFTLDGAESNTPIALRIPKANNVEQYSYYTTEYYASWNSSINKFQVEFVVPKNSRLGPFDFIFAVVSKDMVSCSTSSSFYSNSQLIISKSNFDGIGPVFSKVESIPFSNGKFGWSLTINDPINGFDNGTITVTGSQDNSIYKFDLTPSSATSGNSTEGVYEIIIDLGSNYCITQDYIITFVKLWDTGAKYTVFEYQKPTANQEPDLLINPFYLYSNDSSIVKYLIEECNTNLEDLSPPYLNSFSASRSTIDVGTNDRSITFEFEVEDPQSGINIKAQGPIVYITAESFDIIQCISAFKSNTSSTNAIFECTTELPIGFGSSYGVAYFSVFGILNTHGLYIGLSSQMLIPITQNYKVDITYSLTGIPLLLESGRALSKGGQYFVFGRNLQDITTLVITDTKTNQETEYNDIQLYSTSAISIPNLSPITNDFYVSLKTNSGSTGSVLTTNKLLVSPFIFNDYTPSEDISSSSSSSDNSTPLPTNAPQQCLGNPICGGPTHGTCNSLTGCICIYPWKGKSCQDKVIEDIKPDPNPNEPSTGIDIPDDNDDSSSSSSSNPVNNIKYKSLISLYSLREVDINGNTVKNHKFNNMWTFNQLSDLISAYHINVTTGEKGFNTTVSATLEWFNQSRTITFADQDLEMNANSIKYSIDISSYPFSNTLNHLQLVMSATLTSTSSDSCSSKDFGDTTSGDNSNYINIQIDNKSLYGRFIKRGIIDNNRTVSLSNELLDSKLNAISTPSTSQSYIGITIPQFKERATIDPDFSVLLNSNSASSKSNSVCKSKGLSGAKIAGIVIGSVAFATIIFISIAYHFMKKKDAKRFKVNIQNKLNHIDNNDL